MEAALKALSGSGVIGAVLAVAFLLLSGTIGILGYALKRLVDSALTQQEKFAEFMEALTKSLSAIGLNCQACRADSVATLRDLEGTLKQEIQHVVWASHDKAKLENDASLKTVADRIDASLTGAASSIRESNKALVQDVANQRLQERIDELSRPHDLSGTVRG